MIDPETGDSMAGVIWHSPEHERAMRDETKRHIAMIALTGGPCGGKSQARDWCVNHLSNLGYKVYFIEETATELMNAGIKPTDSGGAKAFEKTCTVVQINKEKSAKWHAQCSGHDKVLIVCDRGVMDNKAYVSSDEWGEILEELDYNETELMNRYDAVFHLSTAADGAEASYTIDNHPTRTETVEEAIAQDRKTQAAWCGHPRWSMISNSPTFEQKMRHLVHAISRSIAT